MERYVISPGLPHPNRSLCVTVPVEYASAIYKEIDSLNCYNLLGPHEPGILDSSIRCAESIRATEQEFYEHLKQVEAICDRLIPKSLDSESDDEVE
jgi:hypothetical protein